MNDHDLARLEGEPNDDQLEAPGDQPFRIEDERSLMWCMDRYNAAEREKERVQKLAMEARNRVDDWEQGRLDAITHGVAYLKAEMERYATEHRKELVKGRSKTIDLPTGSISWRKSGGKLWVENKDALAQWCVEQGPDLGLYRVKTEPEMRKVQEQFKKTGEIPPGCAYEAETETITIKPGAPLLPQEIP